MTKLGENFTLNSPMSVDDALVELSEETGLDTNQILSQMPEFAGYSGQVKILGNVENRENAFLICKTGVDGLVGAYIMTLAHDGHCSFERYFEDGVGEKFWSVASPHLPSHELGGHNGQLH